MQNNFPEEHRPDDEPTAELPVLSEALLAAHEAAGDIPAEEIQLADGTRFVLIDAESAEHDQGWETDPPEAATVVLEETWADLEQEERQRDAEHLTLTRALADAREENWRRRRAEQRLTAELAHQSTQLTDLLQRLREAGGRVAELEARLKAQQQQQARLEQALERTQAQLGKWRALALSPARHQITPSRRAAAGSGSVVNIARWWQDMRTRVGRYRAAVLRRLWRRPAQRDGR